MILTTSYLFSHVSDDSETLFITPYTPASKRDPTEHVPIRIANIAYFIRHPPSTSPASSVSPENGVTCFYIGKNNESSYNTFKFVLDPESPELPASLDHLFARWTYDNSVKEKVDLVINPKSGHGYSAVFLNDVVRPLLKQFEEFGLLDLRMWETAEKNDGERIGREMVTQSGAIDRTVIILGGDGTVHEVLNGAVLAQDGKPRSSKPFTDLILIPTGTANAMFYHLFPPESPAYPQSNPLSPFYSLLSYLRRPQPNPIALPLALNTIERAASSSLEPVPPTLTSVVTSAALHACLLYDAENLRPTHPGLERFKIAAQENVTQWWLGDLILRGKGIKRYASASKTFETVDAQHATEESNNEVRLDGPFAYWVSSLVSRFEPTFVVAPLRSPRHPLAPSASNQDDGTIDLVVIRPLRHSSTRAKYEQGEGANREDLRRGFASRVWEITGGMYQGGTHIDMIYDRGEDEKDTVEGPTEIVEVWRVKEFEWIPLPSLDLKANLVCFDGALHDLGKGGSLKAQVLGTEETGVRAWI